MDSVAGRWSQPKHACITWTFAKLSFIHPLIINFSVQKLSFISTNYFCFFPVSKSRLQYGASLWLWIIAILSFRNSRHQFCIKQLKRDSCPSPGSPEVLCLFVLGFPLLSHMLNCYCWRTEMVPGWFGSLQSPQPIGTCLCASERIPSSSERSSFILDGV